MLNECLTDKWTQASTNEQENNASQLLVAGVGWCEVRMLESGPDSPLRMQCRWHQPQHWSTCWETSVCGPPAPLDQCYWWLRGEWRWPRPTFPTSRITKPLDGLCHYCSLTHTSSLSPGFTLTAIRHGYRDAERWCPPPWAGGYGETLSNGNHRVCSWLSICPSTFTLPLYSGLSPRRQMCMHYIKGSQIIWILVGFWQRGALAGDWRGVWGQSI